METSDTVVPVASGEYPRGPVTPGEMDTSVLVRTIALTRVYQVGVELVKALGGVDLTITQDRMVVFKGRSGSGKTTLLNLIGGLDQPTGGKVYLLGRDLSQLTEEERTLLRRDYLGFVFQSFSLIPMLSAIENVEVPLRIAQMEAKERREQALRCLELVGLRRWADHRPFEMSGGQQQRLSIARALARRPKLIIADEPTSDLDTETGRQVMGLFRRVVQEEHITVLMASHDPKSDEFADDVYQLDDGRIIGHTTPRLEKATP